MSIEEIKSIKKLKEMLRIEIMDNKYLKECCEKAGFELSKNSFEWDGKPKNLVVYALELNRKIDQLKAKNDYLKHKIFRYEEIFKHSADMTINPVTAIEVETFQSGVKALGNSLIAEENIKLHKTLSEIKEIVKPHQRNIDKICGHCRRYDGCHACCIDDINCYQYKKPTTPACDKYCELKEFEINNIANQILQKISEVLDVEHN